MAGRIGVLASGGGTTFEAVHEATQTGKLDAEIAFVICNNGPTNPHASVWEKAQRLGVPIFHVSNKTQETCTVPIIGGEPVGGTISYEASERMVTLAKDHDIHMYAALGFMKRLIGPVLQKIPVVNAHHAPLPETAGEYGGRIDELVMELGLPYSGPTLHWMDKRLDEHGMPMYDLDKHNVHLRIGYKRVDVTDVMRQEWREHRTATLLQAEDMKIEKEEIPGWIGLALEQLHANA